jgi:hypothetical protein
MALVKCGNCGRDVSDTATSCAGCGAPIGIVPDMVSRVSTTRAGAKWRALGFALVCLGIIVGLYANWLLGLGLAFVGLVTLIVRRNK